MPAPAFRPLITVSALAATAVLLAGCGAPPWETAGTDAPTPTSSATATTATAVPTPVPNDLSTGSTERTLTSGALTATVDYYSTLNLADWTASAIKPVTMSLSTQVVPDDGHKVYLQRVSMTAVPRTDTETLDPLTPQVDSATVSPGYLVLSPYSYSQTFNTGGLPDDAVAVTLQFTYDFLVQSTPTSTEYAKQSVTDQVTVAIAGAPR